MKKILLSCVTCLLALGLVTACDDEVEDVTPNEPETTVPGGDTGDDKGGDTGGTIPGGSGEGEESTITLTYYLGYEYNNKTYYFDGTISSTYYGSVTQTKSEAAELTISEVESGYTLSFVSSNGELQYVALSVATYVNFGISEEPFVWQWNAEIETFVAVSGEDTYYIGNYYKSGTTYNELRAMKLSELNSEDGTTYCVSKITQVSIPTSLVISGAESVEVSRSTLLSVVDENGEATPVTWSSSDETIAIVDSGTVTGVATGEATITATSTRDTSVSAMFSITVTAYVERTEVTIGTYDFTAKTEAYDTSTGLGTNAYSSGDALKATFNAYWTGESGHEDPLSTITETAKIYNYASSGNASWVNEHGLLKTGDGSNNGVIKMTLNNTITKVEINQTSWTTSENCTITINTVSHESATAGTNETLTFDIAEATSLDMSFAKRCAIYKITLYGYVD